MQWVARLRRYLRDAVRGRRMARDIDEELRFHVETLVDELTARGASAEEARRIAARRFGRLDLVRDEARYAKGVGLVDDLRQDVRYGLRRLRHQPGFAVAVVVTFALGIGVNTAIFSVVDATVLKPLPYLHADRLFDVCEVRWKGTAEETSYSGMTRERLEAWRSQRQVFDAIAAHRHPARAKLGDGRSILTAQVSPGLFPLLGIAPRVGRSFSPEDGSEAPVVVISEGLWSRAFGRDPGAVGGRLLLNGRALTIVGVMPASPRFPFDAEVDAWQPLTASVDPGDPSSVYVGVVARLRAGLTARSAQPQLNRAAAAIQKARPGRGPWTAELVPIDPRGWLVESQPVVLVVFGAVAFVLLTACANVANLLLARACTRQREICIRAALGAGRVRIVRQLLVDSALLALAGGVAAVALAAWLIRLIPRVLPTGLVAFPVHDMQLDWRVMAFAFAASLVVGLASGLLPAVRGSRDAPPVLLSTSGPGAARTRLHRPTRDLLIGLQVAFALVLLTGAGLLASSAHRMMAADPGYAADGLVAVWVRPPEATSRTTAEEIGFYDRLIREVRLVPGVVAATYGTSPASAGVGRITPEGQEGNPQAFAPQAALGAAPDYFQVLGIRIIAGRGFTAADREETGRVAVIDEDGARRFWPGQDPLGRRIRYTARAPWMTVVGVARNIKTANGSPLLDKVEVYSPVAQDGRGSTTILARAPGHEETVARAIFARAHAMAPTATIELRGTAEDMYRRCAVRPRFVAVAMMLLAGLALVTAAVGVYAMLWYAVTQRTSEIGVRVALGASARRVVLLVLADILRPVVVGTLAGLLAAWWLTKFIEAQLYRVSPHDPAMLGLVSLFFALVALGAAYGPARKAARIDPAETLRVD